MIKDLYIQAGILEAAANQANEAGKIGVFRGGTTGCLTEAGDVIGQCHRKAMVRFMGLQKSGGSSLWFDLGYANEALWMRKLTSVWPGAITGDADYPISYEVDGKQVTGRADMILLDDKQQPLVGVELKAIGATNSGIGVLFGNKPKTANLLQAANYSQALNIPFYLVYTCILKGPLPYWAQKQYAAKEIYPFIKEFKVFIEDDVICYETEQGKIFKTLLTVSGMKNFYSLVADMANSKQLYKRFTDQELDGSPLKYNPCNYCPYNNACNMYDQDFDRWMDEVAKIQLEGDI